MAPLLPDLRALAKRRAALGMDHALSGVVGREEEDAFKISHEAPVGPGLVEQEAGAGETPDVPTLLQWLKDGKQDQVLHAFEQALRRIATFEVRPHAAAASALNVGLDDVVSDDVQFRLHD